VLFELPDRGVADRADEENHCPRNSYAVAEGRLCKRARAPQTIGAGRGVPTPLSHFC
jgi:hypothetical protein